MSSVQEMLTINQTSQSGQLSPWQQALASAIRTPQELIKRLELPDSLLAGAIQANELFPLLVPESFLKRMQPGNINDPLLRQVLPVEAEALLAEGFLNDPVGDLNSRQHPGLLQKYHGRVLLMLTGACAVHCRYCFRRHYPYNDEPKSLEQWQPTFEAIADDDSIEEVILSGGDPLIWGDHKLMCLLQNLERIPHLKRLRIHSRLPIVLPQRVTPEFTGLLNNSRLQPVMVVHANHGNEIVDDCSTALQTIVKAGIPTLNQAVLLKGVNDNLQALVDLSQKCINLGVMPYYLHQLDKVQSAAHFEVPREKGLELIEAMRQQLPGYAVPKYVQEIPGDNSKTPL